MISHQRMRNHRHIGKLTQVAAMLAVVIGIAAWNEAPVSAMTINPVGGLPGTGLNYTKCADEGGTCVAQGIKYTGFRGERALPLQNLVLSRQYFVRQDDLRRRSRARRREGVLLRQL